MSGASDFNGFSSSPGAAVPGAAMPARVAARRALSMGVVPAHAPERTWGGAGSGTHCCICGRAVRRDELGYELEFTCGDAGMARHFHLRCFEAWETERLLLSGTVLSSPIGDGKISVHEAGSTNGRGSGR